MTTIRHSIRIKTSPEKLWHFLTHLDKDGRFKAWHPNDHRRFKVFKGNMGKKGSHFYFEEYLGKRRYGMACTITNVVPLKLIEYTATKPISWLKVGRGHFAIVKHGKNEVTCKVLVEYGYSQAKIGKIVDLIIESSIIKKEDIIKHIEEEQQILKHILEAEELKSPQLS